MQTPRPDRFTYPLHGDPTHGYSAEKARRGEIAPKRPWMRAAYAGGLIGALVLGLFIGFYH